MNIDLVGAYEVGREEELGPFLAWDSWLGPEGKRGVWIKRPIELSTNILVAVSFDQSCSEAVPVESGVDLQELCKTAPRIKSTSDIFIAESRNFNDREWLAIDDPSNDHLSAQGLKRVLLLGPILQCGFSEATGKIVLEMQNNHIMFL